MPIVNTLAFLFTVVGEWWVENKVISRGMLSAVRGKECRGDALLMPRPLQIL